jgi:hypothetical protein
MKSNLLKMIVLSTIFLSMNAIAQNPARDLQNIVGERGSYAEMDLEKQGYVHINTSKSGYDVYSNWWSPSKKKCVTYHLADGSVLSVVDVPPSDCNKSSGAGYSSNSSYNHYSHHHNNNTHYSNQDHDQAFERGHNDGLYNKAYHNIYADSNLKSAYSDGYQSGVNQRGSNTRYHSGRGGYQSHSRVDDLVGLPVDSAAERMGSRGFTEVNQFKHDGKTHRIYYNKQTRQCIDVRAMHGKVGHVENSTRCNR